MDLKDKLRKLGYDYTRDSFMYNQFILNVTLLIMGML